MLLCEIEGKVQETHVDVIGRLGEHCDVGCLDFSHRRNHFLELDITLSEVRPPALLNLVVRLGASPVRSCEWISLHTV